LAGKFKYTPDYIIGRLSRLFLILSGIITLLMVFTATYGVFRRYVLNSPEPYSYELSTMFLLFSFVLAVACVERYNRHIRVDFISSRISPIAEHIILNIIAPIAGLFVAGMFTWKGVDVALFSLKIGEVSSSTWAVPLFPIKIVVPIGYGMLVLVLISRLYFGIARLIRGEKPKNENLLS
jgi:TRAP-type mannitol/chloroaromatic compound transport system permease small subunit